MGDVAVAVNPNDKKYEKFIGKTVVHPFIDDFHLPIVADDHVDPQFGTGAVKITPGHDQIDFEIGQRHRLPVVNILSDGGSMNLSELNCNEIGESFESLPRFAARWKVVKALKDLDLYRGERDHPMTLPICSRSGDVVEPLLKPQWFLKTAKMAERALKAVQEGDLKLKPDFYSKNMDQFLECEQRLVPQSTTLVGTSSPYLESDERKGATNRLDLCSRRS